MRRRSSGGGDVSADGTQVRLLGPVELLLGGRLQEIPGIRRKTILAALALQAGHKVSIDLLIDVVWSDSVPATVKNTLQSHVSYLRRLIGVPGAIVAAPPGYCLRLGPSSTDVQVAEQLLADARGTCDPGARAALVRQALSLWRGRPLGGLTGHPWLEEQGERLSRIHAIATKALVDAELDQGEHTSLIPVIEELVGRQPFDEDLHGQLMLALYRSGRQADALAVFRSLRLRLIEELAIEPGRMIRDLEGAILRQDPALDLAAGPLYISAQPRVAATVAQLPPLGADVVGRDQELHALNTELFRSRSTESGGRAATIALTGMPGVGKSTLALHWAHRLANDFPDGQLYVDLRGFDVSATPLDPANALKHFLHSFGWHDSRAADDLDRLMAAYRTVVASRNVLVVLDNARDAQQIRPLLPNSQDSVAIVTSRADVSSLSVTHSASLIRLPTLAPDASKQLLTQRNHRDQGGVTGSSAQLDEVIRFCSGLPLALAIVAMRIDTNPWIGIDDIANEIRFGGKPLDVIDGGEPLSSLRHRLDLSCATLSTAAAAVLAAIGRQARLELGHSDLRDIGLPSSVVRAGLGELVRASLVDQAASDRYRIHSLVLSYAAELGAEGPSSS
ncbi:BTAD domain-containing putative transcriptional regulator [Kribbella sp. NPDC004536]|uniref:AfsR/SARP family transcriptional regulator n=1 Tax=Kribbella sp. NPDC004536 TaxID=3364106 RepID=UPI00369B9705